MFTWENNYVMTCGTTSIFDNFWRFLVNLGKYFLKKTKDLPYVFLHFFQKSTCFEFVPDVCLMDAHTSYYFQTHFSIILAPLKRIQYVRTSGTFLCWILWKNSIFCRKRRHAEISDTSKCALCVPHIRKKNFLTYKIDKVFTKKFLDGYAKIFLPSQKNEGGGGGKKGGCLPPPPRHFNVRFQTYICVMSTVN